MFYLGAALTIALIVVASYLSGRKVKSGDEFNRGSAGVGLTAGCIIGTMVGGSATIGTAQLAFTYGFSAWWFTLGSGISALFMCLFMSDRLRKKGVLTVSTLIGKEYGETAHTVNALLSTVGLTVNVIAQIVSGTSLIVLLFPKMTLPVQTVLITLLMLLYTVFGGIKSVGAAGTVKTLLICPTMLVCAFIALRRIGGFGVLTATFPREQYFSLFARGIRIDSGSAVSTILGVLTSQAYMQMIMSAKSNFASKTALLISTLLVLPLGAAGVIVGLYMRYITPAEILAVPELVQAAAKTALPTFIESHFSPFFAGLILSTLLITVVGTGASLTLSVSTVLKKDLVDRLTPKFREGRPALTVSRALLVALLAGTALCTRFFNSYIVDISFLSFGFRAASTFAPLLFTLYFSEKVEGRYSVIAMISGVSAVIILKLCSSPVDPAISGVVLSLAIMFVGLFRGKKTI